MIITISGTTGAGKDTIGKKLSERTGLRIVSASLKKYAREEGIDVLQFSKKTNIQEYDKQLDEWQKKEAEKGNCIIISRLSAVLIAPKADLKIWLYAPEEERIRRIKNRDKKENASEYVRERDLESKERFKNTYGVDYTKQEHYDLCINTGKWTPENVVNIILKAMEETKND